MGSTSHQTSPAITPTEDDMSRGSSTDASPAVASPAVASPAGASPALTPAGALPTPISPVRVKRSVLYNKRQKKEEDEAANSDWTDEAEAPPAPPIDAATETKSPVPKVAPAATSAADNNSVDNVAEMSPAAGHTVEGPPKQSMVVEASLAKLKVPSATSTEEMRKNLYDSFPSNNAKIGATEGGGHDTLLLLVAVAGHEKNTSRVLDAMTGKIAEFSKPESVEKKMTFVIQPNDAEAHLYLQSQSFIFDNDLQAINDFITIKRPHHGVKYHRGESTQLRIRGISLSIALYPAELSKLFEGLTLSRRSTMRSGVVHVTCDNANDADRVYDVLHGVSLQGCIIVVENDFSPC